MKTKVLCMMFAAVSVFAQQSFAADAPGNTSGSQEHAQAPAALRNSMGFRYAKMLAVLCCVPVATGATAGFVAGAAISAPGSAAMIGLSVGAGVCGCGLATVACCGCVGCVSRNRAGNQDNAVQQPLAGVRPASQEVMGNAPAPKSPQTSLGQIIVAVPARFESALQKAAL